MPQNQDINASIPFAKMNGLGNQIIVADMRDRQASMTPQAAIALAQNSETKFDQIMEIRNAQAQGTHALIRIWNCDGTLAEACGNGMRCVVLYLNSQTGQTDFLFETSSGLLVGKFADGNSISVDMGVPRLQWQQIPLSEEFADTNGIELQIGPIDEPILHTPSVVNMGNPHAVFWVNEDVWSYDLERFGPLLENHPMFPERANISIAQVHSDDQVSIRTWERGAGLTKACGSAACATLVAASRLGKVSRSATIRVPGGDLQINWLDNNHVMMTGAAEFEWQGMLNPQTGNYQRSA